ncbi:MAG: hypothetical protein WD512_12925, partial [Candidatus Paceibacterota bacterium]
MKKTISQIAFWTSIIFGAIIIGLGYKYGGSVSITQQLPILNLLVTISSIVFGLMGVWLAVIYADS